MENYKTGYASAHKQGTGPDSVRPALTSADSRRSPGGEAAPGRITGCEVGPPARSSVPDFRIHILGFFVSLHPHAPDRAQRLEEKFGKTVARNPSTGGGGAGKGEGAAGSDERNCAALRVTRLSILFLLLVDWHEE